MKKINYTLMLILFFNFIQNYADESNITVSGQVRTKSLLSKSTIQDSETPLFHELRSRLGVTAKPGKNISIHIEAQDSRNFGEVAAATSGKFHTASIGSDNNIGLHQAFFKVNLGPLGIKTGRQKIKLGSQRFLSSLEWHPNARVFDGVSGNIKFGENGVLTALAFLIQDTLPNSEDGHLSLYGFHYINSLMEGLNAEVYGFLDQSGTKLADYLLYNLGIRINGDVSMIFFDEEFQWQAGDHGGVDKAAFYNATRIGVKLPAKIKVALGFDMMSGDDGTTKEKTYVGNYFFAHAYFGWMDRFVVNPKTGVMDFRLDIDIPVHEKIVIKSQNHYLMQAAAVSTNEDPYGLEFDLEIHGKLFPKSKIVLGGGLLVPQGGPQFADDEIGFQFYLMPIFNF